VETILGALIALIGVAGAQWWQARREDARMRHEIARLKQEAARQDEARSYEHRRAAYMAFLLEF
jgi:hypothetical protein